MDIDKRRMREMRISLYKGAAKLSGSGRRFKALLKPVQVLSEKDIARAMAADFYGNNLAQARSGRGLRCATCSRRRSCRSILFAGM